MARKSSRRVSATAGVLALTVVGVALPAAASGAAPEAVVFDSAQASDVVVHAPVDAEVSAIEGFDGVEVKLGSLKSTDAVERVFFDLDGGSFIEGEHGGAVALDKRGKYLFVVIAEGVTADGTVVPVPVAAEGESVGPLLNGVEPAKSNPLDVTVMAASDLIAGVTRKSVSQGTTWAVQPSAYGRAAAEWIHSTWGWPEAVRKGVPSRQGLKEQYLCHPMSQVARFKSYWNLDSWRPTVGLPATIAAGCNP